MGWASPPRGASGAGSPDDGELQGAATRALRLTVDGDKGPGLEVRDRRARLLKIPRKSPLGVLGADGHEDRRVRGHGNGAGGDGRREALVVGRPHIVENE